MSAHDPGSANVAPHASSIVVSQLSALNVCTILGDRLDLSSLANKTECDGQRVVRTQSGREIRADLVVRPARSSAPPTLLTPPSQLLCTGQTPNTALLREAFPESITPNGGFARVRRTMQLAEPVPASELPVDLAPLSLTASEDAPAPATAQESSTPERSPSASPSSEPAELSPSESPSSESAELVPDAEEQATPDVVEDPATRVAVENVFVVGDAAGWPGCGGA